ncbi:MAG: hypothetical protein AAGG07_06555 [Planctomycetota bacterium]
MQTTRVIAAPLALVLVLSLAACQNPVQLKRVSPEASYRERHESVVTGNGPSMLTRTLAGQRGVEDLDSTAEARRAFQTLEREALVTGRPDLLAACAELSLYLALSGSAQEQSDVSLLLRSAFFACRVVQDELAGETTPLGGPVALALSVYNRATGEFSERAYATLREAGEGEPVAFEGVGGQFRVQIEAPYLLNLWGADYFDHVIFADRLRVDGVRHRFRSAGVGAPLVAFRDNDPSRADHEPFHPPEGIVFPATATLWFPRDEPGFAVLTLADPTRVDSVRIAGQHVALASDLTAPFGFLHAQTDLHASAWDGLFDSDDRDEGTGLYLLEPYDPDRIPLILVHGLISSPLTWRELVNEIWGDPELRGRYQVWMFKYPTGIPMPRAAWRLRQALDAVRERFDPFDSAPGLRRSVVIGHSMGGILSRTLVHDIDDRLWGAWLTIPFSELNAPDEIRAELQQVFFYEPDPDIARAVFVASPFGGSPTAGGFIGGLGSSLTRLPDDLRELGNTIIDRNPDALVREGRNWGDGVPTSVDLLREDSQVLARYREAPIVRPFHVILGDRGKPHVKRPSDGVVPLDSAVVPGAESTLVVPSGHNAHAHPAAIREIMRILKLHLKAVEATAAAPG